MKLLIGTDTTDYLLSENFEEDLKPFYMQVALKYKLLQISNLKYLENSQEGLELRKTFDFPKEKIQILRTLISEEQEKQLFDLFENLKTKTRIKLSKKAVKELNQTIGSPTCHLLEKLKDCLEYVGRYNITIYIN